MPPVVALAAYVLIAFCLPLLGRVGVAQRRPLAWLLPALPLASVGALVVFVFGEDDYRGNGISRWDAYRSPGGALEPMFFATVASMGLAAGLMILAVVRQRRRALRASTILAALVALFLGIPTVIGFSTN